MHQHFSAICFISLIYIVYENNFEWCWGFFIFTTKTEEWDARHVGAAPVWECKSGEGEVDGGDKKLEKISTF